MRRSRFARLITGLFVLGSMAGFVLVAPTPALATHPCLVNCRVHWDNYYMPWHFDSTINVTYPQFKTPTTSARNQWVNACCPDSPWYTVYNDAAANHVEVAYASNPNFLAYATYYWNGNTAYHWTKMVLGFDRRDVGLFYTGTGTPPSNRYDAWSAMAEEWGHAQNMNHFGSSCWTMSGTTPIGTTCKRILTTTEKTAAKEPYDLAHP